MPIRILFINVNRRLVQDIEQSHDARGMRYEMKRIEPLCIAQCRIRAVLQQQMNHVEVSIPCGPLQWCSFEVPTDGVDFRTMLE